MRSTNRAATRSRIIPELPPKLRSRRNVFFHVRDLPPPADAEQQNLVAGACRIAINEVRREHPLEIRRRRLASRSLACPLWALPHGDDRYPLRWMRIKEEFTKAWLEGGGTELASVTIPESNIANAESGTRSIGNTQCATKAESRAMCEFHRPLESAKARAGFAQSVIGSGPHFIELSSARQVRHQVGRHRSNARLERPRMEGTKITIARPSWVGASDGYRALRCRAQAHHNSAL